VDAILDGLRGAAANDFIHQKPYVPLADAEAAVHAAADARTRETLALLDAELAGVLADALHSDGPPLAADDAAAFLAPYVRALVARRFPNGGTTDAG
jgi:hypothetical protein